jgi:adenine-specific DNA-methyltransferase
LKELGKPHTKTAGDQAEYSRLRAHLNRYTARNTFDYFIHKDLGGFLRRELDFYIKNEVMHLDDVESESAPRVEQYLSKIKIIRKIAGKIIDFLAQLEDFQKKLWMKKKFVVETSYCITLGCIPKMFYPGIAANEAQRDEWVKLFAIDGIVGDPANRSYSVPLTVEFLEAHPTLVLDTRRFDAGFVARLLEAPGDPDDKTDGLLLHSENFQALALMQAHYREQVKAITIDPPYNRLGDGFPHKDNYQHSSWLTMMRDRLDIAWPLMRQDAALFSNIDENERDSLQAVLNGTFGPQNRIEELIWAQNTTHSQSPLYSTNHEYIEMYAKDRLASEHDPAMFREPKPGYAEMAALVSELNSRYPLIADIEDRIQQLFARHIDECVSELEEQGLEYDEDTKKQDPWRGLYNYAHAEYRDNEGHLVAPGDAKVKEAQIRVWREDNPSTSAQKQAGSTCDKSDPNFRFYTPPHPVTGLNCPHPKRGWLWPYDWPDDTRESFLSLDAQHKIVWGADETKVPQVKRFLHEVETNVAKSFFHDYTDGEKQIAALFGATGVFLTPKPTTLPARFISQPVARNHWYWISLQVRAQPATRP